MSKPVSDLVAEAAVPARFTADEFLRMAELGAFEDMKVELDHGEIIRVTPPFSDHASMQGQVIGKLYVALATTMLDVVGEGGVRLGIDTVQAFDVGVLESGVEPGRLVKPDEIRLAIEIAATSVSRDTGPKLRNYAGAQIQNYWVVDMRGRMVHAYSSPAESAYQVYDQLAFGARLVVPGTTASIVLD